MSLEHTQIEQADLVGRYRTGRLGAEEAAAFEEHLLSCDACLDALEMDAELAHSLRVAATEDALRTARPLAVLAWLTRLSRSRQAAALCALLLVALVLPVTWQQRRLTRRTEELTAARAAAARVAQEAAPRVDPASRAAQSRLEQELSDAQREREVLAGRLERALAPQVNTPILRLSSLRGLGGAPADRLHLPGGAGWVVLSLELPVAEHPSYRVRLKRAGAEPVDVLSQEGLTADTEGSLSLAVHASMLIPGDYEASVQGVPAQGEPVSAGRFAFRVE